MDALSTLYMHSHAEFFPLQHARVIHRGEREAKRRSPSGCALEGRAEMYINTRGVNDSRGESRNFSCRLIAPYIQYTYTIAIHVHVYTKVCAVIGDLRSRVELNCVRSI